MKYLQSFVLISLAVGSQATYMVSSEQNMESISSVTISTSVLPVVPIEDSSTSTSSVTQTESVQESNQSSSTEQSMDITPTQPSEVSSSTVESSSTTDSSITVESSSNIESSSTVESSSTTDSSITMESSSTVESSSTTDSSSTVESSSIVQSTGTLSVSQYSVMTTGGSESASTSQQVTSTSETPESDPKPSSTFSGSVTTFLSTESPHPRSKYCSRAAGSNISPTRIRSDYRKKSRKFSQLGGSSENIGDDSHRIRERKKRYLWNGIKDHDYTNTENNLQMSNTIGSDGEEPETTIGAEIIQATTTESFRFVPGTTEAPATVTRPLHY